MQHTLIEFQGANCSWCMGNMLTHLRAHDSVRTAEIRAGTGCIEVAHDAADFDQILRGMRADLRGWLQSDNGERVVVDLDVHPAETCRFRRP